MRDIQQPGRSVVMSTRGMVSTSQPMATQVGLDVLRRGGNALDAAVAACATLCVTEPQSTGIGGDCFILYHEAASGTLHGLNGSGRAPQRAAIDTLRSLGHSTMPERGILSVTVPGAIHAWETALARFGTTDLAELLAPAIEFAEQGYAVSPVVAGSWKDNEALLRKCAHSTAHMLAGGAAPVAGTVHRQAALGRSLRRIAESGSNAFYQGEIAEQIVAFSHAEDGLLELGDFAAHTTDWVDPIYTDYRGLRLFEIPPNGQGITALMTLNTLRHTNFTQNEHLSPDYLHTFIEAFQLAMAERNRFVSDQSFNEVPVDSLLSDAFASSQATRIDAAHALSHPVASGLPNHRDTIYLSVVDEQRNCASFINSLFHSFGSGRMAGDTGIMLQNRGSGFVLEDGHMNCLAPGKRPMHTIIPAMVYRDDVPVLCYGVMGGHYQAMGHSYVLSNWTDFGMDLQEAIDAPRFLPLNGTLTLETGIPDAVCAELGNRGHRIERAARPLGGGQAIFIDWENGVLQAASDPRKDGCAIGY